MGPRHPRGDDAHCDRGCREEGRVAGECEPRHRQRESAEEAGDGIGAAVLDGLVDGAQASALAVSRRAWSVEPGRTLSVSACLITSNRRMGRFWRVG